LLVHVDRADDAEGRNAAAETWFIAPGNGAFTITHSASAGARTFRFVVFTPAVA
jgi:hypothetical protein